MKILYQSNDGLIFNSEFLCLNHENSLIHPFLFSIVFYNKTDTSYKIRKENLYDDEVYLECEKVIIHNREELDDFMWLVEECGWCEFEDINSIGTWIRKTNDFDEGEWEKYE